MDHENEIMDLFKKAALIYAAYADGETYKAYQLAQALGYKAFNLAEALDIENKANEERRLDMLANIMGDPEKAIADIVDGLHHGA